VLTSSAIDHRLAARHPYKSWLKKHVRRLESSLDEGAHETMAPGTVKIYEKLFQVSFEERDQILRVLAEAGMEAIGSMGDDTPSAVLSHKVRPLYEYFRQVFAQVTNPPIDPLREQIVMSLECCLGAELSVFDETPERAARLLVDSPVLSEGKFKELLALKDAAYAHELLPCQQFPARGDSGLV
jgi:glutamate synthase (NADPH/NADH) large chain